VYRPFHIGWPAIFSLCRHHEESYAQIGGKSLS
jgi:hypothetical protein